MMSGCRELLEVFKRHCSGLLGEENAQFLRLVQKRYDSCNEKFQNSPQMEELLKNTTAKVLKDQKHLFVHLRDLITELKAWSVCSHSLPTDANNHKRKACDQHEPLAKVARCDDTASDSSDLESRLYRAGKLQADKSTSAGGLQPAVAHSPASETGLLPASYNACDVNMDSSLQNCAQHLDTEHLRVDRPQADNANHGASTLNADPCTEIDNKTTLNCISLSEGESCYLESKDKSSETNQSTLSGAGTNHSTFQDHSSCGTESSTLAANLGVRLESRQETDTLLAASCEKTMCSDDEIGCLKDESLLGFTSNGGVAAKNVDAPLLKPECNPSSALGDLQQSKHERHIMRLEALLQQIRDKIEQIRETELSLDDLDNEDSTYIFEDRLQKKFVKVWKRLCELKGRAPTTGRPVERVFKYEGTRFPEMNRKISKFVNRRKIFPDYHDIYGIVKKVNTRQKLNLSANQINNVSREAFLDVGEALQNRRHKDFISTFRSKQTIDFSSDQDPALFDEELQHKLKENRRIGMSRLDEVVSKYSNLQFEKGEEPKEVPDGSEADYSHKSDDDEEEEEDYARTDDLTVDGDLEEKDDGGFSVEMDVDEPFSEVVGGILFGSKGEATGAAVSSTAVLGDTVLGNGSSHENAAVDRRGRTENGIHQQEPCAEDAVEDFLLLKRTRQPQMQLLSSSAAARTVTRDRSVLIDKTVTSDRTSTSCRILHIDRTVSSEKTTTPVQFLKSEKKCDFEETYVWSVTGNEKHEFEGTTFGNNHLAPCVDKASSRSMLLGESQKKTNSPVKVSACLKIPHYLTRPAEGRNGKATLFYPSKVNTAVNVHMIDNVMVINSSDEEDAEETSRREQHVRSTSPPSSGLPSAALLLPSLQDSSSVVCTRPEDLQYVGIKLDSSLTGDDDLIVLSD